MTSVTARVLWVGEAAGTLPPFGPTRRLEVSFAERVGPREVEERDAGTVRELGVNPRWRLFDACFEQQLLNRFFTDELLRCRPRAVVIDLLCGATLDLARLSMLLGYPVIVRLPREALPEASSRAAIWLRGGLEAATALVSSGDAAADDAFRRAFPDLQQTVHSDAVGALGAVALGAEPAPRFGYGHYAFGMRDHALLAQMQQPYVAHFGGCTRVLDLACGAGVFLELLRREGVAAVGVERDPASVSYARGIGLEVDEADVLDYLERARHSFDGIYCSHFVEHLPIDAVERLIGLVAAALKPGGVAVFVFPDPESIRSQLLGFWRDPEHVRFYHPDLIELICRTRGLDCEYHSQRVAGHRVVPFAGEPPLAAAAPETRPTNAKVVPPGWWERILGAFGVVGGRRLLRTEQVAAQRLAAEQARADGLEARVAALEGAVRRLWDINQTWAWDDNAVLRVRKHA